MTETQLSDRARQLEILVAQRRYAEALPVFESYCQTLAEVVTSLPPRDPRIRQSEEHWRNLLNQTRRRVLAGRAHAAARLARLVQPRPTYDGRRAGQRTWQYLA